MTPTISPDLTLRQLGDWARGQAARLRSALPPEAASDPAFILSACAKLAEEVGELQAEVLGGLGYQRSTKADFTPAARAKELADVIVSTAVLAALHDEDLGKVVAARIEDLEIRHRAAPSGEIQRES